MTALGEGVKPLKRLNLSSVETVTWACRRFVTQNLLNS